MPGRRSRSAVIVGGSMAGLFSALLLRRRGWDVQVFERVATPLAGRGAGIVTHPRLWQVMDLLGLDHRADFGIEVTERVTLARDGTELGTRHCPQTMTAWDRLLRMLRAALPDGCYASGAELLEVELRADGVRAHFSDGRSAEADLLVGADGFRSTVRKLLLGEVAPVYAGYVAWRGLVHEAAMPPEAHAALFARFGFCLPPGEQILGYPVAGENNDLRPGHRRYNLVWYRPADETLLAQLLTDSDGRLHALSIPPPLIRPAFVQALRDAAEERLAPVFAQVVRATPQPFLQPIYDLESPRMAFGHAVLLGDSAFVVRPHVGAGVTKAAEDALCLAEALDATPDIPTATARYAAARDAAGRSVVRRARHLGAYMQAQRHTEEQREAALRHHTPEAVMAETALLEF